MQVNKYINTSLKVHMPRYGCDVGYNDLSNRNMHEKKQHGALHWSSTPKTKLAPLPLGLEPDLE